MKTIILLLTVMILVTSMECKKDNNVQNTSKKTISISLNKSDTIYKYSFGFLGDEEGINIIQQAKHSFLSIIKNKQWEERIYQYQPQNNYIGLDTVIIETQKGSDGANCSDKINKTIFIFKINL